MGGYKEHKIFDMLKRKSVILKYLFCIILIFIITAVLIIQTTQKEETKDIVYTETSKLDYKVYLKDNDFFEGKYLEKDNQYIATLIDYILADFDYKLAAKVEEGEEDVNYNYKYKVLAEVNVTEKDTSNSLYKHSEEIVAEKALKGNTATDLKISEEIKVDYNKYNNLIQSFVDTYDLEDSKAEVAINLYVDLEDSEKSNIPAVSLTIPLTTKTMAIDIESNAVNGNDINVSTKIGTGRNLFISLLLIILDVYLALKLVRFMKDTKDIKAVYNMTLRKIMSNYGSYIQKLNNELDFENCQILEIKSFEDLLQIRETINKPILMTEKSSAMETYFFIPNDKDVYIYELKAGSLRKRKGSRYKANEEETEEAK